jgi:hypothetical protein
LKRRIARFSHASVVTGLCDLAQHIIAELLAKPRGSSPSRTFASVTFRTFLLENFRTKLTNLSSVLNLDALGGITRLDIFFSVYRFTSILLQHKANSLITCRVVKSSINVDGISDNALRVLVGKTLDHSKPHVVKSIYQEFHKALIRGKTK